MVYTLNPNSGEGEAETERSLGLADQSAEPNLSPRFSERQHLQNKKIKKVEKQLRKTLDAVLRPQCIQEQSLKD